MKDSLGGLFSATITSSKAPPAEMKNAGDGIRRKNFALRVVGHDGVVVGLAREGYLVLRRCQFLGERKHVLKIAFE